MDTNVNVIADVHWKWVDQWGWHKTSPLEKLALIASEIGEAVNECRGETPTDKLPAELADIILRSLDLMVDLGIEPNVALWEKIEKNHQKGNFKGRTK